MSTNGGGVLNPGSVQLLNRLNSASRPGIANGFPNGKYDSAVFSDPYSFIPELAPTENGGGEPQHNDGYEMPPIELIQHYQETARRREDANSKKARANVRQPKLLLDSWFNRLVLLFILLFSVGAICLVLLLMLGNVGADCSSCDNGALESSQGAQTSRDQPESVIDLSPLVEMIQKLEADYNAMLNHTEGNKGQLELIREILETNHISNVKLLTLNSTTYQGSSVLFALSQLSSTFAMQVQNKESQRTKSDEGQLDNIVQINSTLSAQLKAKLDEPGPQGPRGRNGSQGPQGLAGAPGEKGPTGHNGTRGRKGLPGVTGVNGLNGANGTQGEPGIKGLRGDKGSKGSVGDTGPVGTQGARGVGNFSWCEHLTKSKTNRVQVSDTSSHKMFWVQCSTDWQKGYETNLKAETISGGLKQYTCDCKGVNQTPCKLDYWECPLEVAR